ncbi:unnamed protein product [Protopolystoma xenopodis]|uniref:Uncharacterized protein n=1 Tax=Protopolystoma xenopodis TaxID=117903 RepID=A0A3S5BDR5_9PLAT|nr:unnamed protein product [Protopolystoma xenopodis]
MPTEETSTTDPSHRDCLKVVQRAVRTRACADCRAQITGQFYWSLPCDGKSAHRLLTCLRLPLLGPRTVYADWIIAPIAQTPPTAVQ